MRTRRQTGPKDFKPLVGPGGANSKLEPYVEIERWFRSALKQNPNDATARNDSQAIAPLRSQVQ